MPAGRPLQHHFRTFNFVTVTGSPVQMSGRMHSSVFVLAALLAASSAVEARWMLQQTVATAVNAVADAAAAPLAPAAVQPAAPATAAVQQQAPAFQQQAPAVQQQAPANAMAGPAPATATAGPAAAPALGQGLYVIPEEVAPPTTTTVAGGAATNNTGPTKPVAAKDLLFVMTVMANDQKAIYKNQQQLRQQVAKTAGVKDSQVLFYNQTSNTDKTGTSTMSLIMHVACADVNECGGAGMRLFNSTNQANLTNNIAREAGVQVLPGTVQVYGANIALRGNETLAPPKPVTEAPPLRMPSMDLNFSAPTDLSDFPGLADEPAANASAPLRPGRAAPMILPDEASMFDALDNLTAIGTVPAGGNATVLPGLEPTAVVDPAEVAAPAKSGAAARAAGAAAALAVAAAAVLLL
ncbi:MAG: hypothetical protein J3K34DRAFT_290110 [Monoraphidium minutum]|nr:MAG: hypothetical protein J3K34DRAFT_290110 [Monoraphidium minutum]